MLRLPKIQLTNSQNFHFNSHPANMNKNAKIIIIFNLAKQQRVSFILMRWEQTSWAQHVKKKIEKQKTQAAPAINKKERARLQNFFKRKKLMIISTMRRQGKYKKFFIKVTFDFCWNFLDADNFISWNQPTQ